MPIWDRKMALGQYLCTRWMIWFKRHFIDITSVLNYWLDRVIGPSASIQVSLPPSIVSIFMFMGEAWKTISKPSLGVRKCCWRPKYWVWVKPL